MESKSVEQYIVKQEQWIRELEFLRKTLLNAGTQETLKWGIPVYVVDGKNVIGLAAFKNYAGIWFFQGALLKDESNILVNAQDGKTKAMRQIRFSNFEDLNQKASVVEEYIKEAIQNTKEGKKVAPKPPRPLIIPEMLQEALNQQANLKAKFETFSLSKKREYAEHILSAKREATQKSRLEKIIPMIIDGVGLNDKYRK